MSDAVVIRPAEHEDLNGLVGLLSALFSLEEDFVADEERQRNGLEMMLNNGRGRILTACAADGTVVGMCSGQLTISTAEGGPAVLVEDLAVHEDWRGQGIGEALLNEISKWAQRNRAGRLQLLADRDNRSALDFYAHQGWRETNLVCLRNRL